MDIVQLRIVCEIYRTGSLSKASNLLNKSRPFVSRCLTAFEREFGGKIFCRNGRGVVPTELGERILPFVQEMVGTLEQMVDGASIRSGDVPATVKVHTTRCLTGEFASRLHAEVKQALPLIRLQLKEGDSPELDGALESGSADVVVTLRNGSSVGPKDTAICAYETCLIGLADDPVLQRSEILFRELEDLPLLMRSEPNMLRTMVTTLAATKGVALTIEAEVNSQRAIRSMLYSETGYLVAPVARKPTLNTCDLGPELRAGVFRAVPICDPKITRTLVVASNEGKGECITAVSDAAVRVLKQLTSAPKGASAKRSRPAGLQMDQVRYA